MWPATAASMSGTHAAAAPVERIREVDGTTCIAMTQPLNREFAADGTTGAIRIFDLDSFEVIGRIPNANSPNGLVFDTATGTVAAVSAAVRDVRRIDAAAGDGGW